MGRPTNEERKQEDTGENDDDFPSKYIVTATNNKILLPQIIKIKDPLPGEIFIWRKRTFPKALRMHKKRQDNDPHRFYLSELLLFTSYTDENDLFCDDEDKCRELYLKEE